MDAGRATAIQVLEQVIKALRELSEEDFERLTRGELEVSVSLVRRATNKPGRRRQVEPSVDDERFGELQARLAAAGSREEGQRIVVEAFACKERLFAFAKWLDLPVQRTDTVKRIREKVVTQTVGRRLSGKAVRGESGGIGSGEGV